jgi:predicted DNA-binding transcriptional regulator YafY
LDRDRTAVRAFKVSRIVGAIQKIEGTYEPPSDFDPAAHVTLEAWEIGESDIPTVIRFAPDLRWWAEQNLHQKIEEGPKGSLDVELPVANLAALISWVIGFGGKVEIVSPVEARAKLVEHLQPALGPSDG